MAPIRYGNDYVPRTDLREIKTFKIAKGGDFFQFKPDPFNHHVVQILHNGRVLGDEDVSAARDFYREKLAEGYKPVK